MSFAPQLTAILLLLLVDERVVAIKLIGGGVVNTDIYETHSKQLNCVSHISLDSGTFCLVAVGEP